MHVFVVVAAFFVGRARYVSAGQGSTYDLPNNVTVNCLLASDGVRTCLGIQYAKAPVGPLRFEPPEAVDPPVDVTIDAIKLGNSCMQEGTVFAETNTDKSEDCLNLSIYIPPGCHAGDLKHVMVFIHGGGFLYGTSTTYDPSPLSRTQDVIVVVFNYRLNLFGFMFQEGKVSANGLLDQQLAIVVPRALGGNPGGHEPAMKGSMGAVCDHRGGPEVWTAAIRRLRNVRYRCRCLRHDTMRWVKENIASFGGNSNSITVFGQSVGSASVGYHLMSQSASGLFTRAIMQSGTPNVAWALLPKNIAKASAGLLADQFECFNAATSEIDLECMKAVDATTLSAVAVNHPIPFIPSPDDTGAVPHTIVPENPLAVDVVNNVDVLMGFTAQEGWLLLPELWPELTNLSDGLTNFTFLTSREQLRTVFTTISVAYIDQSITPDSIVIDALLYEYTKCSNTGLELIEGAATFVSDALWRIPGILFADKLREDAMGMKRYFYEFKFEWNFNNFFIPKDLKYSHSKELLCFFQEEFAEGQEDLIYGMVKHVRGPGTIMTNKELEFAERVSGYWADFARTGVPDDDCKDEWHEYTTEKREYNQIKKTKTSQKEHYNKEHFLFWTDFLPKLVNYNTGPCIQNCIVEEGVFGSCSATCGGGVQTKTGRIVVEASGGGKPCPPPSVLTTVQPCNTHSCPQDCIVEEGQFSECDAECGGGVRSKTDRVVVDASGGGKPCPPYAELTTHELCNTHQCH